MIGLPATGGGQTGIEKISRLSRAARPVFAVAIIILCGILLAQTGYALTGEMSNVGEEIYRHGVLGSGKPLEATREAGMPVQGADAACVNCHRRSGLGAKEGNTFIPPIAGRYLFSQRDDTDLPYVESMRTNRNPYTDETLARAIREGISSDGKPLSYLMPRFQLNDADMAELISYLKRLDRRKPPGVTDPVLHFATIITPDADPVKRKGMLAVMEQYFADKNAAPLMPAPRLRSTRKEMFMVHRRWQLHVWQLTGPADTWQEQLERLFAREPVLAVVSGLGGKNWKPVHDFCEHSAVPCLFPNVEAPPPGADHDFYSLYFSRGVELEAALIANGILKPDGGRKPKEVQQLYRAGDSGETGALALSKALEQNGIKVRNHTLPAGKPGKDIAKLVRLANKSDVLVLWLRPADIATLGKASAAPETVYMSGLMGGLERAPLPPGWRGRTHIAYPFALQDQRRVNVDFAFGWFAIRHIQVVDEQVQADTFLACGLLAETLSHMVDTFVPDYLIERIEDMIDRRIITGYYPRLSLAPGQRFASKGGYIVHLPEHDGNRLIADSKWIVP
jgi:hypothetical protein